MTTTTLTKEQSQSILHEAIRSAGKDFDYLLDGIHESIADGVRAALGTDEIDEAVDALLDCIKVDLSYEL